MLRRHAGSPAHDGTAQGSCLTPLESGRDSPCTMVAEDGFGLVGQVLDGKHQIDAVIAEGGFGTVYRGQQKALKRTVAVKVLKVPDDMAPAMRKAFLEGFEREAQLIAQLDHPAIVRVLDYGTSPTPRVPEAPWMVLEWVSGITMEDDLKKRAEAGLPCRTPEECIALLRPVLEALADAHDMGIAHRDLKPANLMLVPPRRDSDVGGAGTGSGDRVGRRSDPVVRLLDFGIAKVMQPDEGSTSGQTHTRATMVAFTMPYASPEQISGLRTGPWTDVHAMALILTEMLTGRPPFVGNDAMELHTDILSPRRPTPAKYGVDVGAWEQVLLRATAMKPGERFANAGALLSALMASVPTGVQMLPGGVPTHTVVGAPVPYNSTMVAVPPSTIPHDTGRVMAQPPASKGTKVVIAVAGAVVLLGVLGTIGYRALGGSGPAAPSATIASPAALEGSRATASPPPPVTLLVRAAPPVAPAVVVPPAAPVAAVVAAPVVAAAPVPVAAVAPVALAAPSDAHGHHGHSHGHLRPAAGGVPAFGGAAGHQPVPLD